jgi:parvulin-like peptidyl-prolyl isomerase
VVTSVVESDQFRNAVFGGTLPDGFRQTVVTQFIQVEVMDQLLAEHGGQVTDEDRAEIEGLLTDELEGLLAQSQVEADTEQVLAEIGPYTDLLVERNAMLSALGRTLTEGEDPGTEEVACARHILVDDEALANDLLAQLQAGGDFAALAEEHSMDPGSGAQGGDLGCAPPDRYVPEFADAVATAPIDEVVGPVETQFGYHLIVVYERRTEDIPVDQLGPAGEALQQRLRAVDISVSNDLGRWDPDAMAVVPA